MDFKILKGSILFSMLMVIACAESDVSKQEFIIGTSLDTVSSLSDSASQNKVSLYDKATKRIHSFDLVNMLITNSFEVTNPNDEHYIIANNNDDFVVDLSKSQLSIYKNSNEIISNPIRFNGTPVSSAYNKTNGFLVIYDDLNSVGVLKLGPQGDVLKSWVGGQIIDGDTTLLSGDVDSSGKLILSLSDNRLAIVDLDLSLDQAEWVFTTQNLPHSNVKWLAPITADRILYQSQDELVLYDYLNQVVVSELSSNDLYLSHYSKAIDPHVIYRKENGNYLLAYTDGVTIRTREITNNGNSNSFLQSTLDLVQNQWTAIRDESSTFYNYSGTLFINSSYNHRKAYIYRFSDMLNLSYKDLPDVAQLKQAGDFVFALFPSELGYAQKIELMSDLQAELKLFNIPYIN